MAEEMQVGLYRIDTTLSNFTDVPDIMHAVRDSIVSEDDRYEVQSLRNNLPADYRFTLLYKKVRTHPKWKQFLDDVATAGEAIFARVGVNESFVLLIHNPESGNLFAIAGGTGYFAIQSFLVDNFGIDVFARLIQPEDKILKSTTEKSVMGSVIGAVRHFRKPYNLHENDGFGKIYKGLNASLSKDHLITHFGFTADEARRDSICIAKPSFKIGKAITFQQLLKIVQGCEHILTNYPASTLNQVEKLDKGRRYALVTALKNELIQQLWTRYQDQTANVDFDLCHPDLETYLTASSYEVRYKTSERNFFEPRIFSRLDSVDEIFTELRTSPHAPTDFAAFQRVIDTLKIYSFDENDQPLTKGWLMDHVFGDILHDGQRYFLIDKDWYLIHATFLQRLDEQCSRYIRANFTQRLNKPWQYLAIDEDAYNRLYIGQTQTIVLDKITPRNIELCDILQWDDTTVYLCHIKAKFGNTMRDLCSQVFIAADLVRQDMASGSRYLGQVYDHLVNKRGSADAHFRALGAQVDVYTKEQFLGIFAQRELVFVLGILDTGQTERDIRETRRFNSNIAKFSLQELTQGMRGIETKLEIAQIPRSN